MPIYIGCEGKSEAGYSGWLRNLARDRSLPVYLRVDDLGSGGGDPLSRIEMAVARLQHMERNAYPIKARFLLLDTDQLALDAGRANQARALAAKHKFCVVWQEPTHEAFLLRHIAGCHTLRPPDKRTSDKTLVKQWAEYKKPWSAEQLESRIDVGGARRVGSDLMELAQLLEAIGLWKDA